MFAGYIDGREDADVLKSLGTTYRALVLGASGALGCAFVEALQADTACAEVVGLSRSSQPAFRLEDEASIAAAASTLHGSFHLIIDATGALTIDGQGPEKHTVADGRSSPVSRPSLPSPWLSYSRTRDFHLKLQRSRGGRLGGAAGGASLRHLAHPLNWPPHLAQARLHLAKKWRVLCLNSALHPHGACLEGEGRPGGGKAV